VWPIGVAVDPVVLGQQLSLEEPLETLAVEELISELAVERLDEGVLPKASRFNVGGVRVREAAPVPKSVSGELGSVVHADELGSSTTACNDAIEDFDGVVRVDGSGSTSMARASFVNSSVMAKIFKVQRSEVWSKRKSVAHTWSG
jgi:hypothetical protein